MKIMKINIRIGQKIIGGFLILIIVFTLNAGLSIFTLNQSASLIGESSKVINPSRESLNEMMLMVTNSKMYITNWVYLQSNTEDKEALKQLHETGYPQLKEKLILLKASWKDKRQVAQIDSVFLEFENLLKVEKNIMGKLVSFEALPMYCLSQRCYSTELTECWFKRDRKRKRLKATSSLLSTNYA
jgi:hypothetical protein